MPTPIRNIQTRTLVMAGVIAAAAWATAIAADPYEIVDLRRLQDTFATLADRVRPSVVAIRTYRTIAAGDEREAGGAVRVANNQGSGVIIRSDGSILTNDHVVAGANQIDVILHDGRLLRGRPVQADPRSDLAVIRIDAGEMPAARLGDASGVRPGHWSFTVGNPFGLADSDGTTAFAVGNVTALGKSLSPELDPTDTRYYGDLIQTSSAINPGNSGGPMFNLDGEVVGVCTAMLSRSGVNEGLGFAVPISRRNRQIIDTLLSGQPVRYGYLGVKVVTPNPDQRRKAGAPGTGGAYIVDVIESDGPAAKAGLRAADVVVEFDGMAIANSDHLVRLVGATPVAAEVGVAYYREGTRNHTKVRLAERPVSTAAMDGRPAFRPKTQRWRHSLLGEPTDALLSTHGLTRADAGLVVIDLVPSGAEYKAGLRNGAVIMKYNDERVRTIEEFLQVDRTVKRTVRLTLDDGTVVRFTK